jgi:hypothetical protein
MKLKIILTNEVKSGIKLSINEYYRRIKRSINLYIPPSTEQLIRNNDGRKQL